MYDCWYGRGITEMQVSVLINYKCDNRFVSDLK